MKFLVTGTAGFVGFHLASLLLDEGHEVAGVDAVTPYYDVKLKRDRLAVLEKNPNFEAHEYYLENFERLAETFEAFKPDVVIHLAAQAGVRYSLEQPRAYVDSNVVGSFNIIELSKTHDVSHLIMASTSSVYGASTDFPFQETDNIRTPLTIYSATKAASELMGHCYANLYGLPITIVRFFSVYGPWGRPDMALFKFTKAMFEGEPIDVYNHGNMIRDFTYVTDLVKAIRLLADCVPEAPGPQRCAIPCDSISPVAPYRIVNIGNSTPVTLIEYIEQIEANVGVMSEKNMMPMQPGDVYKTEANNSLLRELTGFLPSADIKVGVKAFVDWYRDYYRL
jgi:UDP-glucuronate 4-epimerase